MTAFIKIFSNKPSPINFSEIGIWILFLAVVALINQTIDNFSSEEIFKKRIEKILLKNKKLKTVFICDDFDRIDKNVRGYLYPLLTQLSSHSNVLLIAVGEYDKIASNSEESVLIQKIIGNVEPVPTQLSSNEVWIFFENQLELRMDNIDKLTSRDRQLTTNIKDLFIYEKRTVREAKLLLNLLERRYFQDFQNKVNFGEQLSICYLYNYHHEIYLWLVDNLKEIYDSDRLEYYYVSKENQTKTLKEILINTFSDKIHANLADTIYQLFIIRKFKPNYPTLINKEDFHLYFIDNYDIGFIFSKKELDKYLLDSNQQVQKVKYLLNTGKFPSFYSLFLMHYMSNEITLDKIQYEQLLTTICLIEVDEEYIDDSGLLTISELVQLKYKLIQYIHDMFNIEGHKLFLQTIFLKKEIDISLKLKLLPNFIPAGEEEQTKNQFKIVERLFKEFKEIPVEDLRAPFFYLYFYKVYYDKFSENFDDIVNEILLLDNNHFFYFVTNKLSSKVVSSKVGSYQVIYLDNICYNDDFKHEFLKKVDSLSHEDGETILYMIKNGN